MQPERDHAVIHRGRAPGRRQGAQKLRPCSGGGLRVCFAVGAADDEKIASHKRLARPQEHRDSQIHQALQAQRRRL